MASTNLRERIDRRFVLVVLVLGVVVAVALGRLTSDDARRSSADESAEGTPGHTDGTAPPDTSPFEMASPQNAGNSTTLVLPGDVLTRDTDPTTTVPPTTEPVDPPVLLPDLASVTDLCGFEENLAPFQNLPQVTPQQAEFLMNRVVGLVGRYAEVAPPELRPAIAQIRDDIASVRDVLSENGWDPTSSAYGQALSEITASVGDPQSLPALLDRVVAAERDDCG